MSGYNRLTGHHTGGGYTPNATDKKAYPLLIDGDGMVHQGNLPITANIVGRRLVRGRYYPHTWKLNSGNLGLAICCMAGARWGDPRGSTKCYPLQRQVDAFIAEAAKRCAEFGIEVTGRTVLSHAEVEPVLGVKQRQKWDFDYPIRSVQQRDPVAIFDEIRQEILWKMDGKQIHTPKVPMMPIKQGDVGESVKTLQRLLGVAPDGIFGPKTRAAVVAFQKKMNMLPDGNVGRMTWAAFGL